MKAIVDAGRVGTEIASWRVLALSSPWTATILHVGSSIVYAEPPPGLARPLSGA
jgi:hypothetical protein